MNLKQFLTESKHNVKQIQKDEQKYSKEIKQAKKDLAKKHKVDPKYLEFAFVWEFDVNRGTRLCFNITDINHKKYGSTVAEII